MQGSCSGPDLEFTAPGDNLDSDEPAQVYIIKFALTAGNLTGNHFENGTNIPLVQSDLSGGSLSPVKGGSKVKLTLNKEKLNSDNLYFFAMIAKDAAGNQSPVSNVASTLVECVKASNGAKLSLLNNFSFITIIFACFMFN